MSKNFKNILSGTLLIAGTTIGAGMLGIPSITGQSGFLPATFFTIVVWLYMILTGFLFLEVTLWMHKDANILSMSKKYLNNKGKLLAGFTFIFLYYCLMVAYFDAGAPMFAALLKPIIHVTLTGWHAYAVFGIVIGLIIGFGIHFVDKVNYILIVFLIFAYFSLIIGESPNIEPSKFIFQNWKVAPFAAPILFGAFGYHNVIPSLTFHFKENAKVMRYSIFFGTLIPLIIYLFWQWLIIGTLSQNVLEQSFQEGGPITQTMQILSQKKWIKTAIQTFGLSAIVTSLLGVSFSVVDFLGDGLKLKRVGKHRFVLCLLTLVPPFIITSYNPSIFLLAIGIAGGFGEAFLNGILPAWLVWIGRYRKGHKSSFKIPGGKIVLAILLLLGLVVMGLELKILLS